MMRVATEALDAVLDSAWHAVCMTSGSTRLADLPAAPKRGMMTPTDDDPTRATIRVAEGVVALLRAEAGLGFAQAKANAGRSTVTLLTTLSALFLTALAMVVVVFAPMLWAFRPSAALGTLGIAISFALVASLAALKRWRRHQKPEADQESRLSRDLPGRDHHAVPR